MTSPILVMTSTSTRRTLDEESGANDDEDDDERSDDFDCRQEIAARGISRPRRRINPGKIAAWGMSRLVPERLLFWNVFGYPDYMLTKYSGNYTDILKHWWFESIRSEQLDKAKQNNSDFSFRLD